MRFTRLSKKIARDCGYKSLVRGYEASEKGLHRACQSGDKKAMNKAMANHQAFEYALLYRETPEFKNKRRKKWTNLN